MIATSCGFNRLTRVLVRLPRRGAPRTPRTAGACTAPGPSVRERAAGRDLAQGARGEAGVGGDEEVARVSARRPGLVALGERDLERRTGHGQLAEALAHGGGQPAGGSAARLAQGRDLGLEL